MESFHLEPGAQGVQSCVRAEGEGLQVFHDTFGMAVDWRLEAFDRAEVPKPTAGASQRVHASDVRGPRGVDVGWGHGRVRVLGEQEVLYCMIQYLKHHGKKWMVCPLG